MFLLRGCSGHGQAPPAGATVRPVPAAPAHGVPTLGV